MPETDAQLIAQVLVYDDHTAFEKLVRRHQSAVRNFLRHLTRGNSALADDLAQETFVRAYQSLVRFRGEASFSTWLFGIAHNQWRNARRQQKDHAAFDEVDAQEKVESASRVSDLRHDLALALRDFIN